MNDEFVILCVDDEEAVLKSLRRCFRNSNYTVLTALNGIDGLEILKKNHVDLIICDQRMPEMSGTDFLIKVTNTYPDIIKIMLSGYQDFNNLVNAINEGDVYKFITKPWNNDELKEIVRLSLEQNKIYKILNKIALNAGELTKITENITVETLNEQLFVKIKFNENKIIYSAERFNNFLNYLLKSIEKELPDKMPITSGNIAKKNGYIEIKFNIDNGLILDFEIPYKKNIN